MPRKIIILVMTSVIALFASSITETYTFSQNDLYWSQITIDSETYDYVRMMIAMHVPTL